jgi:hypothetical protein
VEQPARLQGYTPFRHCRARTGRPLQKKCIKLKILNKV